MPTLYRIFGTLRYVCCYLVSFGITYKIKAQAFVGRFI